MYQLVIGRAQNRIARMFSQAGDVDHVLRVFDAKPDGERFGFDVHAAVVQHFKGVARAVADGEDDVVGGDEFAIGERYTTQRFVIKDDVGNVSVEANLAAEFEDFLAKISHDLDQPQRADVLLADVNDFFQRARVHEVFQYLTDMMPAILDAGMELAVGERTRADLAELHVGFRIEVALAPEAPHVLRAVAHALAAFQNQRPEAHARQRQPGEQATGTGADDDGPRFDICRRLNRVMIGLVRRFPDVLAVFEALKQRRFIPDRGVEGVDEHDFAGLARVVAAPAYTIA